VWRGTDCRLEAAVRDAVYAEVHYRIGSADPDPAGKAGQTIAHAGIPIDRDGLKRAVRAATTAAAATAATAAIDAAKVKEAAARTAAAAPAVASIADAPREGAEAEDTPATAADPEKDSNDSSGTNGSGGINLMAEIGRGVDYVDAAFQGCTVEFALMKETASVHGVEMKCTALANESLEHVFSPVRCTFCDRNLNSRMKLVPTPARLK
jgi:hypothetical protein